MTTTIATTRPPLWRDRRVLSWVFQSAVFAVVAAFLLWLYGNYRENVASSGIPTNLNFLDNPASFEIPGNDFSQNQPVRDAYVEGILNTLRVSVPGIVLATILGTVIGVGRLSRNWVARQVATAYVEIVRNVPLLVLLTFTFLGVVLLVVPRIEEAWTPAGILVMSNRGIGIPWYSGGSGTTLVGVGAVGVLGWWLVARLRRRASERTGRPSHAGLLGAGAFLVVVATGWVALGFAITTPRVAGRQIDGGIRIDPSFFALLIALVVYTASHIAEIVRGSIQAVPSGQDEAAQALAMTGFQRMWYVVLPQAMRIAVPPLGNQYLNLIKNSSLGAGFGYFELTNVTRVTVGNGSPAVPAFALALAMYVGVSVLTSLLVNVANRRFRVVER